MSDSLPRCFAQIEPDLSWSFADLTARQTGYGPHCYHRYPAKFIPQVAARLIAQHSAPGEVVLDPFMGSGTTLVEALVQGRRARGTDINPAALVASRAKTTAISPIKLRAALGDFDAKLSTIADERRGRWLFGLPDPLLPANQERLDWWFPRPQQRRLGIILAWIEAVGDPSVRDFLRCVFSHVLKTASYWLMKSSKPTRDKAKLARGVRNPVRPLRQHIRKMERANLEFWNALPQRSRGRSRRAADVRPADARKLPWRPGTVDLVVTSPPYVTSYEYADLHELTSLWLGELADLAATKDQFIGSAAARNRAQAEAHSDIGREIVATLRERSQAKAEEARQYFLDMEHCFAEMHRVLKPGGTVCNVIGNTSLKGVEILNAEVHAELMAHVGLDLVGVIKRVIPSKTLPQTRDPRTGKFTSRGKGALVEAYPEEFILIARKR